MVRRSRLQIGENLPQRLAHGRPIVGALPQHQPRMADRPAHGHIYEAVHRSAAASPSATSPTEGGKYGAVDVKGAVSRFGAELVALSPKVMDGPPQAPAPIWDHQTGRLEPRKRTDQRLQPPYAGARWL